MALGHLVASHRSTFRKRLSSSLNLLPTRLDDDDHRGRPQVALTSLKRNEKSKREFRQILIFWIQTFVKAQ